MGKQTSNRFARMDSTGRVVALVADGLPEWSEDLSTFSDADLGALHDAYVAEATEMRSADPASIDASRASELAARIPALRTEAAARFTRFDEELAVLAALSDEDRAAVVAYSTGEPPADPPADPPASDPAAQAALDQLGGVLDDPAPAPAPEIGTVPQIDPATVAAHTSQGVAAGIAAGLAPFAAAVATLTEAVAARPAPERRPITARDIGSYRPEDLAPRAEDRVAPTPRGRLVHTGDVPGVAMGHQFTDMTGLVDAFIRRHRDIGVSTGTQDEKVLIASYQMDTDRIAPARDLRGMSTSDGPEVRRRIEEVCGVQAMGVDPWDLSRELPIGKGGIAVDNPSALVASGGLAAPVEPYYAQLLLAEADRPVLGAMPGFVAERGGIRLVLPSSIGTLAAATQPGYFVDGHATTGSATFTSATAAFTASDVGSPIVQTTGGTAIAPGTIISAVGSGTSITLSHNAAATSTTVHFSIKNRNPNNLGPAVGVVTAAQDAAGPPSIVKYTYDVPDGTQAEHDVYSVYTSLQFANLTARTFPEQVELNIRLANALAARTADTQALNYITGWSTLFTAKKTFGTARQLLAQWDHMAAYYRNLNRMDPTMVLRLGIPAWAINAMRGDYISSFIGGDGWGLSDAELAQWFQDRKILPFFYWDGPSDLSQLFPAPNSTAINTTGHNTATPQALPDYPGTTSSTSFRTKIVSYMWAEGTWLGLSTGELNLGLVRDSILNSQNRFRNFEEVWETPAFVGPSGTSSFRCVHTVAADGTYGAAASITLGAGSGL